MYNYCGSHNFKRQHIDYLYTVTIDGVKQEKPVMTTDHRLDYKLAIKKIGKDHPGSTIHIDFVTTSRWSEMNNVATYLT